MKKLFLVFFLFANVFISVYGELPDFSYGNIPYGETYQNVLKMFEGEKVKIYKREWNESNYYLDFIAEYDLSLLGNGVSKYEDFNGDKACCFKYPVVKTICIESKEWKNCSSIYFTFVCTYGQDDYSLMMVKKNNNVPEGLAAEKLDEYYVQIRDKIDKRIAIKSLEFAANWKEKAYGLYDYQYYKGLGAKWKNERETVYFIAAALTNTYMAGICDNDLVLISNEQERKFLKSCAACIKDRETQKDKKLKEAADNFSF
jgi:hypothetical protein